MRINVISVKLENENRGVMKPSLIYLKTLGNKLSLKESVINILLKDIHKEKALSNKTPVLTKSTNIDILVVISNQLFTRGC